MGRLLQVAIVGASGAVGLELQELLAQEHNVEIRALFDSKTPPSFEGIDVAFFCLPAEMARTWITIALKQGVLCIDSSTAYRKDPHVALVIPEVNPNDSAPNDLLIASPNCVTTLLLLALAPLHTRWKATRVSVVTYQAVSGAGLKGMQELVSQTESRIAHKQSLPPNTFPYPCAFGLFLHESPLLPSGYVVEEEKIIEETHKILRDDTIAIAPRAVRVPVLRTHALAVSISFKDPISLSEAKEILSSQPGLIYTEALSSSHAEKKREVLCGALRIDPTLPQTLELFIIGDQLWKGAALNMLQILQLQKKKGFVGRKERDDPAETQEKEEFFLQDA